jgi:spore germination cell wall hydrolase CwlJ-like protein
VAEVILNRVDHANYPDSVCDVVNEGTGRRFACQFTYTCDGRPEEMTDERALHRLGHIARIMLDGAPRDLTGGATHYHADWVNPALGARLSAHCRIRRPHLLPSAILSRRPGSRSDPPMTFRVTGRRRGRASPAP